MLLIALILCIVSGIKSNWTQSEYQETMVQLEAAEAAKSALQEQLKEVSSAQESLPEDILDYQSMFPELEQELQPFNAPIPSTVYLTFDDGPSDCTEYILDVLKEYDIKATFFVVGVNISGREDILQRIAREGHTIGIHTYSHQYGDIYANVAAYLTDFEKVYTQIYDITGQRPVLFRFPGGSLNSYNRGTYQQIISEMLRRGFIYHDWNISGEDSVKGATPSSIISNVLNQVTTEYHNIVLLHDSKQNTADSLDEIVRNLKERNFTFAPLTPSVRPVTFAYRD